MLRECLDTLQSHEIPYLIDTKNALVRFSGQCEINLKNLDTHFDGLVK